MYTHTHTVSTKDRILQLSRQGEKNWIPPKQGYKAMLSLLFCNNRRQRPRAISAEFCRKKIVTLDYLHNKSCHYVSNRNTYSNLKYARPQKAHYPGNFHGKKIIQRYTQTNKQTKSKEYFYLKIKLQ